MYKTNNDNNLNQKTQKHFNNKYSNNNGIYLKNQ